jgi:hypothetical protein
MKTKLQLLFIALAIFTGINRVAAQGTTVFPIATNASLEELSGGIAGSGSNYLVSMLSGSNVCVQLVSTNGTLIGSLTTIGESMGEPRAAFGSTNYLVGWFDDYTSSPLGEIVSGNGTPTGQPFSLPNSPEAIASDGTNFLIVMRDNSDNIYGQLVTSTGALSGSEFLIGNQTSKYPSVAFGKTNYLVVLNACYGVFVTPGGSAGSAFQINQTTSAANNFDAVAFDGTNYLVAWMWNPGPDTGGSLTNWDIFGRLVSQTGNFPGNELELVTDPGNDVIPSLAFDGSDYLLTWGYGFQVTTNTNIRFQFLNRSASAIGPEFVLFNSQGTNAPLFVFPNGLIFDGTRFAMAATLGSLSLSSGEVYGGVLSPSFSLRPPRIASFQQNGLLTWTNAPGTNLFVLQSVPAPAWINPPGTNAFVLQWASVLTGPWSYASSPLDLTISTNTQTTVTVPLVPPTGFYRVAEGFGLQSLHGAWISPQIGVTNVGSIYFMADGNGTLTNFGIYNVATPPGYYSVNYAGGVTLTIDALDGTNIVTGQFVPPRQIVFTGSATNQLTMALPVENVALCAGTWSGILTETNDPAGLNNYSVSLSVSTNGSVNLSGDFTGTGWMFALAPTNGALASHFTTTSTGHYDQFSITATLNGNAISGSFNTDSGSGANAVTGTVLLTRP